MLARIRNLFSGKSVGRVLAAALGTLFCVASAPIYADGSETLGLPSIPIASGTTIVADGTGMTTQPGTIDLDVPGGAAVNQVLLYWEGFGFGGQSDDTVTVNGIPVTGTLIGGPDLFFDPTNSDATNWFSSTYRADITGLGVVGPGSNSVTIAGMDFNVFNNGKFANNGAGIMAIIDDGSGESVLEIRDGDDIAWTGWPEPRKTTVPQTFNFAAAATDRTATLSMFFAAVQGAVSSGGSLRPTVIEVSVGGGTPTEFNNLLGSFDGEEWDTLIITVDIPAGATSLTVQVLSKDNTGSGENPASFVWIGAGLNIAPEPKASLGDRVWKDTDGDGTQDCSDTNGSGVLGDAGDTADDPNDDECGTGIDDVPVMLLMGNCADGSLIAEDTTSDGGFYLFEGLDPNGSYCVMFGTPTDSNFCVDEATGIDLGDPLFTLRNEGDDGADSDADPITGKSGDINLSGSSDLTIDAGIVCPVKIGDRVWEDDGNGMQDPDEDNANIEDVTARLYSCGENMIFENGGGDDMMLAEQDTGADGMYMFGGRVPGPTLDPGKYYVIFDSASYPNGYSATLPNQGPEDDDSECMPEACIDLTASGAVNLAQDCGLVPPPPPTCKLTLDKSCRVATPPPQDFDKCDGKLKQFTVKWTGGPITISGLPNDSDGNVNNGQEVTFFGPFSQNDVVVNISGASPGQSKFHMSCSDVDFNDPSDCGNPAGDGKGNDSNFNNGWTLEGFIDKEGRVLDCDVGSDGDFTNSCSFEKPPAPSCETTGKPDTLTWRYDGGSGSCNDSTFNIQKDFECTGSVDETSQITVIADQGNSLLVNPGEEFTIPRVTNNATIMLSDGSGGTQDLGYHTSCSQPLEAGLTAGALTLVALDGQASGADVTYRYLVTNDGDPLDDVVVADNLLGDIGGPVALGSGESAMFDKTVSLFETTTNIGTASGKTLTGGGVCVPPASASDSVTVTVTEPTCQVSIQLDNIEDRKIKWKLTNLSNVDATIDDLMISWPGTTNLKKVKFDGNDILKDVALSSPTTISNWLKEVKDRTLKAGDSGKTLEIEFTNNFPLKKNQPAGDFDLNVDFEEGCSVEF